MSHTAHVERERFEAHFMKAAAEARDFAKKYVREPLPDAMRFRVRLNRSNDAHDPGFVRFPEDSGRSFNDLSADEAIELLWRAGLVPQWIDIAVIGETGIASRLELTTCGRFTADEERLYYLWTPVPPFGVKGPTFPYGYVEGEGERFSIYSRAQCMSLAELSRARDHASDVWSLDLEGDVFDDDVIGELRFPAVEIVTLGGVSARGRGFVSLHRMPKLRIVRLASRDATIDVSEMPQSLDELCLRGYTRIIGRARAKQLLLASTRIPEVDGPWSTEGVQTLTLAFPSVPRWIQPSASISSLHIQCDASDEDIEALLAGCGDALEHVTLRRQRVTNRILDALAGFPKLRHVDLVDTDVTKEALRAFLDRHPGVSSLPSLD